MLQIRVGGVTIDGRPSGSEPEGLFVKKDGFVGWDDGGGDARRASVDRPSSHGGFDLPVWHGSRVITIDGYALARSEQKLAALRSRIVGICGDGPARKITVTHQGQSLHAMVRRGGKHTFRDAGIRAGLLRAVFMVQLVAPDPRKYGQPHDYLAGEPAVHYGNFPATPILEVTGVYPSGYTVGGPDGKQFVVSQALTAGQTHRIDMRTGRVFRDGVLQLGAVSKADLWTIPAGLPGVTHTLTGSGTLRVLVTDTYI